MNKRRKQAGYTLIELVTTTAILAVLSAVGVGKFTDLHGDARTAAAQSMAGALGSASASNFLIRSRGPDANSVAIANCTDTGNLLLAGAMGTYSIQPQAIAAGATQTCTLNHMGQPTGATFLAHGTN